MMRLLCQPRILVVYRTIHAGANNGEYGGNHLSAQPTVAKNQTSRAGGRRSAWPVAGLAGVALAGSAVIGGAPTLTAATELRPDVAYLRGTNIGTVPPDAGTRHGRTPSSTNRRHPRPGREGALPRRLLVLLEEGRLHPHLRQVGGRGTRQPEEPHRRRHRRDHLQVLAGARWSPPSTSGEKAPSATPMCWWPISNRPNGGILERFTGFTCQSSTSRSRRDADRRRHHLRHRAPVRRVGRLPSTR